MDRLAYFLEDLADVVVDALAIVGALALVVAIARASFLDGYAAGQLDATPDPSPLDARPLAETEPAQ